MERENEHMKIKITNGVLNQEDNSEIEETKNDSMKQLRTGDKYVIRKLISLKITPESMQDYVNLLRSGANSMSVPQNNMWNNNNMYSGQQYLSMPQQPAGHNRSNS